jgi:hypothetical protein
MMTFLKMDGELLSNQEETLFFGLANKEINI